MLDEKSLVWLPGSAGMFAKSFLSLAQMNGLNVRKTSRQDLDLFDPIAVENFIGESRPSVIILAAAKVGGIAANIARPMDFLVDNLVIQNNIMASAAKHRIEKVVFFGSGCIYPREAPLPFKEESLFSGQVELSNHSFAVAKLTGIEMVKAVRQQLSLPWFSVIPSNFYGPNDNFSTTSSHVMSSIIRKVYDAKINGEDSITLWGDGSPMREFTYVDDVARGVLSLLEHDHDFSVVNVNGGQEVSIAELSGLITEAMGFEGGIQWDISRPNGIPRKIQDNTKLTSIGWTPQVDLRDGIQMTTKWFSEMRSENQPIRGT